MKATDNTVSVNFGSDVAARSHDNAVAVHGMRITRDLHQAEAALDEALIRQANLLATMVRARRETAVGPFTGQEALLRLAASQKAVLDASGELARVHGKLLDVGREMGSVIDECPPAGSLGDEGRPAALADAA
ncbi:hypothetical protein [Novosphingobium taihuense]|uniref:Uncharacterized protein n=1 Tax=Novosphingobium taihuense TaxID=260085 RepID=A0A7W7ESG3_9SPHN|nr:hypothetical protein [Novosphingobium taihuense]MBB4612167.1 hypothetical protein [Novosphingobium taihuense]TWH88479.1 hypothetical protein IQ25_00601 [Novosphingobium taihuense]